MPQDERKKIAGVVLVGGQSSRMGTNKALLDYRGRPLVAHMMALLEQAGLDVYISGTLAGYEAQAIPDQTPFAGPAAAIRDVAGQLAGHDGILFVPVDMPFLTPAMLQPLLQQQGGAHYQGWPLPLYFESGQRPGSGQAVHQMIAAMDIKTLPLPAEGEVYFANLNTPEEWKEAVQQ